jgi:hypothetical protein
VRVSGIVVCSNVLTIRAVRYRGGA